MFGSKKKTVVPVKPQVQTADKVINRIDNLQKTLANEKVGRPSDMPPPVKTDSMPNVIGTGTVLEGNVTADGDLYVVGMVRGDVVSKSKVVIASGATVEGNVTAEFAEIAGTLYGNVQAYELVVIKATGVIVGDVQTKNLNVESGSSFNGRLKVGEVDADVNAGDQTEALGMEPMSAESVSVPVEAGASVFG